MVLKKHVIKIVKKLVVLEKIKKNAKQSVVKIVQIKIVQNAKL